VDAAGHAGATQAPTTNELATRKPTRGGRRCHRDPLREMTSLTRAAELLESAVASVLSALAATPPTAYEADVEANLMIHLTIRDAEGVAMLAREGTPMYPAAMVLARAAYEGALRTMWMLSPDDSFEREARYLVMLKETERLAEVAAQEFAELSADDAAVQGHLTIAQAIRGFREGVASKLPRSVTPIERVPSLREIIAESGYGARYLLYKFGCQYVHSTNYATGIYRKNLGDAMEIGEFIDAQMWAEPLQITWWSLQAPTARLLEIAGGDSTAFAASLPSSEMERTVTALGR
jgi:hypothetical protein